MLDLMSKPKRTRGRPPKRPAEERGPILYLRIDKQTDAAIQSFIASQLVPPDRTAVGLSAIHEFLTKHGYWPPAEK